MSAEAVRIAFGLYWFGSSVDSFRRGLKTFGRGKGFFDFDCTGFLRVEGKGATAVDCEGIST